MFGRPPAQRICETHSDELSIMQTAPCPYAVLQLESSRIVSSSRSWRRSQKCSGTCHESLFASFDSHLVVSIEFISLTAGKGITPCRAGLTYLSSKKSPIRRTRVSSHNGDGKMDNNLFVILRSRYAPALTGSWVRYHLLLTAMWRLIGLILRCIEV